MLRELWVHVDVTLLEYIVECCVGRKYIRVYARYRTTFSLLITNGADIEITVSFVTNCTEELGHFRACITRHFIFQKRFFEDGATFNLQQYKILSEVSVQTPLLISLQQCIPNSDKIKIKLVKERHLSDSVETTQLL